MATKKLTLSPTRASAFLECPLKYKYLYIDKIGRFYYRPKPGNAFGGTLHRVLQTVHQPGAVSVSPDELLAIYRQSWVSSGYADSDEESRFKAAGEEILRRHHAGLSETAARTILTEKMVRWDMGDFILAGRLDRLDEHADGTLEIIDYKSGRLTCSEEEVRNSLAMSVYQLIVGRLNPDRRVFASIYCLAGGVKASAELTSDELAAVDELTREVASSITGAEEFRPHRSDACKGCDFYRLCARQPWFDSAEEEA